MSNNYYLDWAAVFSVKKDPGFRSIGRRFLALTRRSDVLRGALGRPPANNPLAEVEFQLPLSVAGQPSAIIVRAEALKSRGIPVAFEFDARGAHRGEPIWRLGEKLQNALCRPVRDTEILRWYECWVGRSARLNKRLARTREDIQQLVPHMDDAAAAMCGLRFALVVDADLLGTTMALGVLATIKNRTARESVVVGFDGRLLRLNGSVSAECTGVQGNGGAVVKAIDLHRAVSETTAGDAVFMAFNRKDWEIEIARDGKWVSKRRFMYHLSNPPG